MLPPVAFLVGGGRWPIGNPFVAGLPQTMARHLPTSAQVPREGRIIGRSTSPATSVSWGT